MNNKLRAWQTSPAETKTAWMIAISCITLVIGSFLWPPKADSPSDTTNITTTKQKIRPEAKSIEDIITDAGKQPARQIQTPVVENKIQQPAPSPKTATPATVKKSATASTSGTLSKGYYIQTAAFKEHNRALLLQKKLSAYWKTHTKLTSNNMIAVWVGPYNSLKEAEKIKSQIAARANIKGFIVKN